MLVAHFNRKNKRKLKFRKLFASVSSYILLDQLKKKLKQNTGSCQRYPSAS